MSYGSLWQRLVRGVRWSWTNPRFGAALPPDLDDAIMTIESRDRLHAKQGRSTARHVFHPAPRRTHSGPAAGGVGTAGDRPLAVYLKRHFRLPWFARLAALVHPAGRYSPGAAEWTHLERARALGVPVPDVVAAGERIGPWAGLQSYLIVAELTDSQELNVALPEMARELDHAAFQAVKRRLAAAMARITARLHQARAFHKDLYLCHFYLERNRVRTDPSDIRLVLIDLHRLGEHRLWPDRWRWKDLGQLLYSTHGVDGVDGRDILRFWSHYRRALGLRRPRWQARMIRLKAERYRRHNQPDARVRDRDGPGH